MKTALTGFLALAALALAAAAQADGSFVERYRAATAAHQAKDYARMESELLEALKLRPGHPTATYNLACARALRGNAKGAIEALERLADMGLSYNPGDDADFASLEDDGDFRSLRRAFAANREPRGRPARAFRLLSPSFIPEGIAYDSEREHFFVGSVHERRIQRVRRDDSEKDFVAPGELWSVLGMAADSKRRLLWVTTAALPETKDAAAAELGRTAVLGYDLDSGERKHRFVLDDPGKHSFGDLVVLGDGSLYVSDSGGGMLYALDPSTGAFKAAVDTGALSSPQGLAVDRDGRGLYVADYTQGLYHYEFESRELARVEAARDVSLYGIDGLARHEDQLIAVQNGIRPHRVVRLHLSDRGRKVARAEVLAANLKEFDEPTLGVVVKDRFYFVANSQWGKFDDKHQLPPNDQLRRPLVLRLDLKRPEAPGRSAESAPQQPPSPLPKLPLPKLPGR